MDLNGELGSEGTGRRHGRNWIYYVRINIFQSKEKTEKASKENRGDMETWSSFCVG